MRIKHIYTLSMDSFERQLNTVLTSLDDYKIIDIKYHMADGVCSAVVMYEKKGEIK